VIEASLCGCLVEAADRVGVARDLIAPFDDGLVYLRGILKPLCGFWSKFCLVEALSLEWHLEYGKVFEGCGGLNQSIRREPGRGSTLWNTISRRAPADFSVRRTLRGKPRKDHAEAVGCLAAFERMMGVASSLHQIDGLGEVGGDCRL
jgi:hypothetical protein